jgi:hypothetical protein
MASVEIFLRIGLNITRHGVEGSLSVGHRKIRAFFGTSPAVCVVAWDLLAGVRPNNPKSNNLLWALMLLKRYCIESFNAVLVKVTEKTFREWSLLFVDLLADMPVVNKIINLLKVRFA